MPGARASKSQARVVVTGVGALTPLGLTMEESWQNAIQGRSGIAGITKFDASLYDVRFAGEVKNFQVDNYIHKKEQKKMDIFIHYSIAASKMALDQSGLVFDDKLKDRTGVIIGSGMGGLPALEDQHAKLLEKGPSRVSPFFIPMVITNLASGNVSIMFGLRGPNYSITSACATGAHSIGEATRYIRDGLCDVMLAGGAESTVCPTAIAGFGNMRALSTRNDDPTKASRPFDKDRDGFVLGEGAAVLVLENLEHAQKRGAKILCEVTGYGASSDAYHMTNPAPGGEGGALCIRHALQDASLQPSDIQYVNAHGTSTPVGDGLEVAGIKSVFGDHAKKLWVSSTKSMTGHLLGAAGAVESAFCVYTLMHQMAPPTINLEHASDDCDLDFIPGAARKGEINHALNNSFGFGGTNASLIFSRWLA